MSLPDSILHMTPAEKLQLVEDLWEDLASHPDNVPVHEWQLKEIERRKANLQSKSGTAQDWEDVKRRIRGRHGR
jgi:putative addiction module component (TIGR02574 family)